MKHIRNSNYRYRSNLLTSAFIVNHTKTRIEIDPVNWKVMKHSRNIQEYHCELNIYSKQLDFIPKLISSNSMGILEIELIKGIHIVEMERPDFLRIGEMIHSFHMQDCNEGKVLCHIDNNPRNYMFDEQADKYYMIDFADSRLDYPEWDITGFLLFWASAKRYDRFMEIQNEFIIGYGNKVLLDSTRLQSILSDNIRIFDERRLKYSRHEPFVNPDLAKNRLAIAMVIE